VTETSLNCFADGQLPAFGVLNVWLVAVLRIRDVYPGSRILIFTNPGSRISDPKTTTKERGEKKLVVIPFYVATNFKKL
jgi:hypothetical protein